MSTQPMPRRSTPELLASVRDHRQEITEAEVALVRDIAAWAEANTVTTPADAATICDGRLDTGVPIAGEGAPLVSEFALMELCAVLGRSTASGREYVGKVLETRFRLPGIWDGIVAGRIPVWRALRIADHTRLLPAEAAAWVDRHLAGFAGSCTGSQVDPRVAEALVRFDPAAAEARRRDAAERRHFDIDTDQVSFDGTIRVDGELDLADGLDLEDAIARRAKQLAQLGCEESLDVRRSMAAGELARHDHTLDYEPATTGGRLDTPAGSSLADEHSTTSGAQAGPRANVEPEAGHDAPAEPQAGVSRPRPSGRKVELHVHLTDAALRGAGNPVARCGNTRSPISPEQVKEWCGTPGTTVIVRPIVDLNDHDPIGAYEIPERHRRQVTLRDTTCRFPFCNRRAERCDLDHAHPHARGGPTCPCNEVPLCRSHHRAKTHSTWRYAVLDPGTYLWTSPHGHQYLVNHHGTRDLTDEAVASRLASSHLNHRHQP